MINPVNFVPNPSSLLSEAEQYQEYLQLKHFQVFLLMSIIVFAVVCMVIVAVAFWLTRKEADQVWHEMANEPVEEKTE